MTKHRGFTVVEIVVTIIVLSILVTISVVSYRGLQSSSRDKEREADVQAIATYLESIYSQEIKSGSTTVKRAGSYPSTTAMNSYAGVVLDGLARGADNQSWSSSTVALEAVTAVSYSQSRYRYMPTTATGASCPNLVDECRSFKIYYQLEAGSGTNKIMESKRQ